MCCEPPGLSLSGLTLKAKFCLRTTWAVWRHSLTISGARETGLVVDVAVVVMLVLWSFPSCFFQVISLSTFTGPIEALKDGFPHFTVCLPQSQKGLSGNFKKNYPIIGQM